MRCCLPSRRRRSAEDVALTDLQPSLSHRTQGKPLKPYRYRPLRLNYHEIRLIKLLPAKNFEDEIGIEIFHRPLVEPEIAPDTRLRFEELRETLPEGWTLYKTKDDQYIFKNDETWETQWTHPSPETDQGLYQSDAVFDPYPDYQPAYEALSYTWGEDVITAKARVVSTTTGRITTLDLRPNLALALKHLRQATSPRVLWIDAICIDQSSFSERSREVKRMRLIYALARRVVVWLGIASETSTRGLDLLAALGSRVLYTQDAFYVHTPLVNEEDISESLPKFIRDQLKFFKVYHGVPYSLDDYNSILHILDRSWWDRLWQVKPRSRVYQEIHLARPRSIIQCGSNTRLWKHIRNAISYLHAESPDLLKMTFPSHLIGRRGDLASVEHGDNILYLLQTTRFAEYANPHDRVFALLGLVDPREAALINADYNRSIVDVFWDVCQAHVELNRDLLFLKHCDWPTHGQNLGHPSWIPDWSTWRPAELFATQLASGFGKCRIDGIHGLQLTVDGVLCGTVEEVGWEAPSHGDMEVTLRSWEAIARLTEDGWPERFIETLTCGEFEESRPNFGHPTLERYWKAYFNTDEEPLVSGSIRGRSIFRYSDVGLGIGSPGTKIGDLLVVILGCDFPMALRRSSPDQDPATHVVVGPAYVSNLGHSRALLGSLPDAVKAHIELDWQGYPIEGFRDVNSGTSYDDPRLGPLPDGWTYKLYEPDQKERRRFVNTDTGKTTSRDPRLTSEELRKRGTTVEEFVLV